ncbi:MFS transporter [Collinsella sp. BA40]|nr:MFS transporter [Collinsella sp. BA40]TXF35701.1 MFS transporter [Collinsella sp. BA40]
MVRETRGLMRDASRFIVGFGLVSMLMDVVYEGALSVQGPLLAS